MAIIADLATCINFGIMYNVYITISLKNSFGVKKMQPSKVESYLEMNARTDWSQQDLISEYDQGV